MVSAFSTQAFFSSTVVEAGAIDRGNGSDGEFSKNVSIAPTLTLQWDLSRAQRKME